jgi:mannose-6-phosphate isomerase-like protein (cupin superfamily)
MKVKCYFDVKDVEPEKRSGGRNSFPLVVPKFCGNEGFAMGYHELEPGGEGGPLHTHEGGIQEAFFFISGEGVLTIGEEEYPIKPLVAAWAPPGVPHRIVNTGRDNLCFIWIYSPPKSDQI